MTSYISHKSKNLTGKAHVPGDKSISHRSLILASQVLGTTTIRGLLEGEDVIATANALRSMGVNIVQRGHEWVVQGVGVGGLMQPDNVIDCGNSGTSARLLMGLVAPYPFTSFFTGDASLRKRPMGRVTEPLGMMGVSFLSNSSPRRGEVGRGASNDGSNVTGPHPNPLPKGEGVYRLPLAVIGTDHTLPITYDMPVASAQVKSAVLLAGLNTPGKTTVIENIPTRDHTETMLKYFGINIEVDGPRITIEGKQQQTYQDHEFDVPSDPSSAAFLVVAALITEGSQLTLPNVCMNPHRTGLFVTLQEMGADIQFINQREVAGEKVADIVVKSSHLQAVDVPAERAASMIDEYPILAIAAARAQGTTVMRGLKELRVKESNRFNAIIDGLNACGVTATAQGDDIIITGAQSIRGGASIVTHLDHRICMSFLVMGMVSQEPVSIDSAEPINTSFPGFVDMCNMLGARLLPVEQGQQPLVIAVDGSAASGKGTLARRLARYYGLQYLDTGSLYRAVGLKVLEAGEQPENKEAAAHAAKTISLEDLDSPRLRQEVVGNAASIVSAYGQVRAALLDFQRKIARNPRGAVLDGRDIGTVVCPDAPVKLFLTASLEARAKRRHKELSSQGIEVVYESVYEDLKERDERDAARAIAPMKPAVDALTIDTSTMDANSVFEKAKAVILQTQLDGFNAAQESVMAS